MSVGACVKGHGLVYETSHETDDTLPRTGLSVAAQPLVFASIWPLYSVVSYEHSPSLSIEQASTGKSELSV